MLNRFLTADGKPAEALDFYAMFIRQKNQYQNNIKQQLLMMNQLEDIQNYLEKNLRDAKKGINGQWLKNLLKMLKKTETGKKVKKKM